MSEKPKDVTAHVLWKARDGITKDLVGFGLHFKGFYLSSGRLVSLVERNLGSQVLGSDLIREPCALVPILLMDLYWNVFLCHQGIAARHFKFSRKVAQAGDQHLVGTP
jgi:hypothetical protein